MSLANKIDFAMIISVNHANPNGDPLNGNRPRTDYEGYGEISDVCLKRKIRDRLQADGQCIFVQSDEKKTDGMSSLKNRAIDKKYGLGDIFAKSSTEEITKKACERWFDVRAFGQIFAFSGGENSKKGVSIPIRGPVTVQSAFSLEPVTVTSTQITKSVSGEGDGSRKGSDTMGMKHRVDKAIYKTFGAISPQLAERTGFSLDDAEILKMVLPRIFEGDASSARPEGSLSVLKVFWWQHDSKSGQFSSSKVHGSLKINSDGTYDVNNLPNLNVEEIDGF